MNEQSLITLNSLSYSLFAVIDIKSVLTPISFEMGIIHNLPMLISLI